MRSAATDRWASAGGHAAVLQMALSLQELTGASLTVADNVTAGSVRAVSVDGEVLLDLDWNTISADTDFAAERVMNGRRQG